MDFKKFIDFGCEVFDHNYEKQKQFEDNGKILILSKLQEYINQYPNAGVFLHYPNDEQAKDLNYCYTVNYEGPTQLLPVLSVYADDNKIVLSYLDNLECVDFSESLVLSADYINSDKMQKSFEKRNTMFVEDHHMIFMEHIPDSLGWKSESANHKMHQAFAFMGAYNYMLWSGYYFTPHY